MYKLTIYFSDQARSAVDTEGGIASLVRVLREYAECKEEGADRLRVVACGFLLNLTNSNGKFVYQ